MIPYILQHASNMPNTTIGACIRDLDRSIPMKEPTILWELLRGEFEPKTPNLEPTLARNTINVNTSHT